MEHPIIIDAKGKTQKIVVGQAGLIARYLKTAAGRNKLAASMAMPIRRQLNYQGIARRALNIQQLPLPAASTLIYNNPFSVASVVIPEFPKAPYKQNHIVINARGKTGVRSAFNVRRVIFPTFEIFSNPTVRISDVRSRRFDLIDRVMPKAAPSYKHNYIVINTEGRTLRRFKNRKRFPIIDRAVFKARQEIMAQEDAAIFAALDATSTNFDISYTTKENK